jgi:hypothetical protein
MIPASAAALRKIVTANLKNPRIVPSRDAPIGCPSGLTGPDNRNGRGHR